MVLLHGGRIIDPVSKRDEEADIVVDGEKIREIGKFDPKGNWDTVYDAAGKIVAPGLIDIHVHFRDPGFTYKEDIHSGAAAAARGGFTTVVCMANTKPVLDTPALVEEFLRRAEGEKIRIHTLAAVTKGLWGRELTDMKALQTAGASGFSDDGAAIMDAGLLRRALLSTGGLPISLHEEDSRFIGVTGVNDGKVSTALGFKGAHFTSESSLVKRDCRIAQNMGRPLHFQHLSCAASVECVEQAKKAGAPVTAEVTPQHFSLTEDAVKTKGAMAKVNPPLRTEADRLALIAALKSGVIDMIATDHAPHTKDEKSLPLKKAPSGMTGLETSLALGITTLVIPGHLSLAELVHRMTTAPAALYGFDGGALAEGGPADIVVFDEQEKWTVKDFASKAVNSPFTGAELTGKVHMTFCRGRLVYEAPARA
ncbi:MAG: dihydroorotase [Treponematales bacterium]